MPRLRAVLVVASLACSSESEIGPSHVRLVLPPVDVAAGDEIPSICHSWTLDNDAPLFVNAVVADTDPGFHHSDWFFVPEEMFVGPDGAWPCEGRAFDGLAAAGAGGALFIQSTQSPSDEQRFAPGAAIHVPARVRIVAESHLLNLTESPIQAGMTLDVELLPRSQVEHELQPMGFAYPTLSLPPARRSRFVMECPVGDLFAQKFDRAADFSLYYSVAHYHDLGRLARAELMGGERSGEMLFETSVIGDALGRTYEPPVNVSGMSALRLTCEYDNQTDRTITWGLGDGEMCAMGFYIDAPYRLVGFAVDNVLAAEVDGVLEFHGECRVLGVDP